MGGEHLARDFIALFSNAMNPSLKRLEQGADALISRLD